MNRRPLSGLPWRQLVFSILVLAGIASLTALGVWQLERRAWKHDLIERVDQRVRAVATEAPGPEEWPRINDKDYAYRHIRLQGVFLRRSDTLIATTTALGQGYWVLTPLRTDQDFTVLVNRGFIPAEMQRTVPDPPDGHVAVSGLLRITEPKGRFLRANLPSQDRWYSRDVTAIAAARNLSNIAPYFVDSEITDASGWPRGGLTVVQFPNNHLVYAVTWFSLDVMLMVWAIMAAARSRRLR